MSRAPAPSAPAEGAKPSPAALAGTSADAPASAPKSAGTITVRCCGLRASSAKASPAGVSATPCGRRWNSDAPTHASSARMRRLKAGWVTRRTSAAREKLPVCATATT